MTDRELMRQVLNDWIDFSETASQRPSSYPNEIQIEGYVQRWERLEMAFDALRDRLEQPEPIKENELFGEFIYAPTAEKTAAHQKMVAETVRLAQPDQDGVCRYCDGTGCVACDARKQPEQEPVGEIVQAFADLTAVSIPVMPPVGTKLYTTPPRREWVGLTIEDKQRILDDDFGGSRADCMDAAEKILRQKNT